MATFTVTTASQRVYTARSGQAQAPDQVAIRLAPGVTGTVFIQRGKAATVAGSFFIKDSEVYSTTLISGQTINLIVSSGTTEVRIDGEDDATYG